MAKIPERPDEQAILRQMFPGKQQWQLSPEEHGQWRDAMIAPTKLFEQEKDALARYYTMIGNANINLQIARDPNYTPMAEHDTAHRLTKKELESLNRYRGYNDGASPIAQDKWKIAVPQGEVSAALLASGYLMFTEHGSDASHLMKYLDNDSIPLFYASLEAARVAITAGEWHHRGEEVRAALGEQMRLGIEARRLQGLKEDDATAPFTAVRAQAWGLNPWDVLSVEHSDAAVFGQQFAIDIERAVRHADDSRVLDLSIQLAAEYEVMTQAPITDPGPSSDSDDDTPPTQGDDEDSASGGSSGVDVEDADSAGSAGSAGSDDSDDDDSDAPASGSSSSTQPSQDITVNLADIQGRISKEVRTAQSKVKSQVTRTKNRLKDATEAIGNVQVSYAGDHLLNIYPTPDMEKIQSSTAKLDIKQSRGILGTTQNYVGEPSQKTWELTFGNTKVFRRKANTRGRVGILIDISGSMGCGCNACTASSPDRPATLAYAAANALAELDSDAIVAAYCGMDEIYRLKPGHTLSHAAYSSTGGATPTCAALEWLEKAMGGELEGASCILITDGFPSACGAKRRPQEHTSEIAHRMYNSGMKFGCVLVHTDTRVVRGMPEPVTAIVNRQKDLGNIQSIINAIGGNN